MAGISYRTVLVAIFPSFAPSFGVETRARSLFMLFFWTNDAEFRQEGNILKRLHVLAVVLVLLALVVSSVSAHVIIEPPPFPDSAPGGGVSAEEGKASPILFRHGAVIVEGTDGSDPPYSSPIRCRVRWRVSS